MQTQDRSNRLKGFQKHFEADLNRISSFFLKDLKAAIEEVLPTLKEENVAVYYLSRTSDTEGVDSFVDKMDAASDESIPLTWRSNVNFKSPAMFIYTSGTTGIVQLRKLGVSLFTIRLFKGLKTYSVNCNISMEVHF